MVERHAVNVMVLGSSPSLGANKNRSHDRFLFRKGSENGKLLTNVLVSADCMIRCR